MGRGTTVVEVKATPVNVPLEAPYQARMGLFSGFSKTIVEVRSSDGVVGLGEAPNPSLARLIDEAITPRLIGQDPYDLAACERKCLPPVQGYQNTDDVAIVLAYAGVEMALWDLVGKTEGRSIASLLGGQVRTEVAFSEYFAMRERVDGRGGEQTPAEAARYCARVAQEDGSTVFEGKVGVRDLATEVAMVREVRAALGPDAVLRLDANMAWSMTTAREALRKFEPFNISSFEEPVRSHLEMARLRSSSTMAFSSHDPNLREAVVLGAPDAFVINLAALGGIRRTVAFVAACAELRVDVWFYSDPGIATAAYLQVSAAMDWLSQPHQTLGRWLVDDVIAEGPLVPSGGVIRVPDGPGLGVTLDEKSFKRCNQRFIDEGPYDSYLDPIQNVGYVH